jgi:SnoaL-like domain
MTEHANATLARRGYAAFASGDLDTLRTLMAEDAAWHQPGRTPIAGDYVGRERVIDYFGKLFERSDGTFKAGSRLPLRAPARIMRTAARSTAEPKSPEGGSMTLLDRGAAEKRTSTGRAGSRTVPLSRARRPLKRAASGAVITRPWAIPLVPCLHG